MLRLMVAPTLEVSAALVCAGAFTSLAAQSPPAAERNAGHPRIAVVLSGGSAKGFSQIGALDVIESAGIPIDLVTGTSMGAIIGGLYAAGYSPGALERLATTEDWSEFFKRPLDRRNRSVTDKDEDQRYALTFPLNRALPGLPNGVISRQGIAEHIERFTWPVSGDTDFATLPTAYAALTTELATGNAMLLRSGSLAQVMEASAAVPGAFAPVRLTNGRLAVDGAVVRNIPASDARALGADILICVDVSEHIAPVDSLHSLVDILDQTVSFRVQWSNAIELPLCNVVIDPDISGLPSVAFGRASEWIARGRVAARAHLAELAAIADSVRRTRGVVPPRRLIAAVDSVFVHRVRWTEVSDAAQGIVRGTHGLRDDTWLSLPHIEEAVARLYSTGRFDQVSFRLVPNGGTRDLWFDLTEGDRDVLGIGVRYDTPKGVALLTSVTVADWLSPGSNATISARLGGDQQFEIRDVLGAGPTARFSQTYRATARRTTLPQFRDPVSNIAPAFDVQEVAAAIEPKLGSAGAFGLELAHDWSRDGTRGADSAWSFRRHSYTTLAGTVQIDTYDRSLLPTRGFAFLWRSEFAAHDGKGDTFTRHFLDVQGAYSVVDRIALVGHATIGNAFGAALPLDKQFLLGGSSPSFVWPTEVVPFLGLPSQSRIGTSTQVFQAGVRAQIQPNLIVAALGNIGNVFATWPTSVSRHDYLSGCGVSVASMLPVGLVSLTVASRGAHTRPVIEISAGSAF
jgi:NTE family protein